MALDRPTLRGPLGPPELSWRMTVTGMGTRAANSSRYAPVPSVEPSSTAMTSMRSGASVCASTEARHSTRYGIASYAPITTVTSG